MTSTGSSPEIVVLKQGVSVTRDALALLWSLEDRGLTVELDDGDLLIGPRGKLTGADRQQIRDHKPELIRLVEMERAVVA